MPYIINQNRDKQIPFKRRLYVMKEKNGLYSLYHGKTIFGLCPQRKLQQPWG